MRILESDVIDVGPHLEVVVDGITVKLSHHDRWISRVFPVWHIVKGYVSCRRWVETEYGNVLQCLYLHKLVVGAKNEKWQVDHVNRDRADCRRANLRMATARENQANKPNKGSNTGYRGVHRRPELKTKPYVITIMTPTGRRSSKRFETAEEAALEHDRIAFELYGEFAVLNFPDQAGLTHTMSNDSSSST